MCSVSIYLNVLISHKTLYMGAETLKYHEHVFLCMTELTNIDGVGPSYAETLVDEGYENAEAVATATPDELDGVLETASGETLVENAGDVVGDEDTDSSQANTELTPGFSDEQCYHLISALVDEEVTARQQNDGGQLDLIQSMIEQVRTGEPYTFTLEQLSVGYRATNNLESKYRGMRGMGTFVSEIREINQFFQEHRSRNWPDE